MNLTPPSFPTQSVPGQSKADSAPRRAPPKAAPKANTRKSNAGPSHDSIMGLTSASRGAGRPSKGGWKSGKGGI